MNEDERRKAYSCNIAYVRNSELGFDFLRDHFALSPAQTVLRSSFSDGKFDSYFVVDDAQVTSALDKVQVIVEEKYREIREQTLNFDDIFNDQRRVIYKRRQDILFLSASETLKIIGDYNKQTVVDIVSAQT